MTTADVVNVLLSAILGSLLVSSILLGPLIYNMTKYFQEKTLELQRKERKN